MNSKECLENLTYCVNGMERKEKYYNIIKQSLDRLEKLEKAIKIINKKINIVKLGTYLMTFTEGNYEETELTQEEYELLKEALNER